jgi:sulfopyruvate decarboxylase alpha subunit
MLGRLSRQDETADLDDGVEVFSPLAGAEPHSAKDIAPHFIPGYAAGSPLVQQRGCVRLAFAPASANYARPLVKGTAMDEHDDAPAKWQDELYDLLRRNNVTQFAYVPDAGHRILIDRSLADPQAHSVALTTEEEGVALLAGADLGGARGVLLMQSSGTGNCINMLSLIKGGRFPFLTLVSMRGDFGEGNPWQFPMGRAVEPVLAAMGVICLRIERPEEVVPTVSAALTMVFQSGNAVAVLLTQKLLGAKQF